MWARPSAKVSEAIRSVVAPWYLLFQHHAAASTKITEPTLRSLRCFLRDGCASRLENGRAARETGAWTRLLLVGLHISIVRGSNMVALDRDSTEFFPVLDPERVIPAIGDGTGARVRFPASIPLPLMPTRVDAGAATLPPCHRSTTPRKAQSRPTKPAAHRKPARRTGDPYPWLHWKLAPDVPGRALVFWWVLLELWPTRGW
jgi:hypothetical protein